MEPERSTPNHRWSMDSGWWQTHSNNLSDVEIICKNRVLRSHLKEFTKVKSSIKIKMINKNPPVSSKTCSFVSTISHGPDYLQHPFTTKHGASSNWRRVWQSGVVSSFTGSNVLEVLPWFNRLQFYRSCIWGDLHSDKCFCSCWVNDVVEPNTYKAMGGFMVNADNQILYELERNSIFYR